MDTRMLLNSPVALTIGLVTLFVSLGLLSASPHLFESLMLHPYSFARGRRRHTILTSGLIHADFGHLLFNLFSFYFFAFVLESHTGHWQFAVIYLVALMAADIPTIIRHRNDPHYYCLGASGAVTAVIFSFVIYEPTSRIAFVFFPIGIPAPIFAVAYVLISCYGIRNDVRHINHEAHLWGGISGLALTAMLHPAAYADFFRQLPNVL